MEVFVARRSRPLSNNVGSRRLRRRLVIATYAGCGLVLEARQTWPWANRVFFGTD